MLLIIDRNVSGSTVAASPSPDSVRFGSESGLYLDHLPSGTVIEVQTANRVYTLVSVSRDEVRISGHPTLCPKPLPARVDGSTWGGSMLKQHFIGHGMYLEFQIAGGPRVRTTRVVDIRTR